MLIFIGFTTAFALAIILACLVKQNEEDKRIEDDEQMEYIKKHLKRGEKDERIHNDRAHKK